MEICVIDIIHRYSIDATEVQKKFQQEGIKSLSADFNKKRGKAFELIIDLLVILLKSYSEASGSDAMWSNNIICLFFFYNIYTLSWCCA